MPPRATIARMTMPTDRPPPASTLEVVDVLIVGAGICGLSAAANLVKHGLRVTLLEKGSAAGGRLATRRVGLGRADHGAQFFTARSERFAALVETWRKDNLVFRWSTGWSDGSLISTAANGGHPRYAVHGGMNSLAQSLVAQLAQKGVRIETQVEATAAAPSEDGWRVQDDSGRTWRSRSLVLTAPVPQSLALLSATGVRLPADQEAALQAITYAPCLCALCWAEGTVWLPAPGAVQRPQADIAWIADNQRKGISPYAPIFTLHASPAWSAAHFEDPDEALLDTFCTALSQWTAAGKLQSREVQIKRWRYALPTVLHSERCLRAANLPPLYFGGDAFGSPRVEGAALSGLAIGDTLADALT